MNAQAAPTTAEGLAQKAEHPKGKNYAAFLKTLDPTRNVAELKLDGWRILAYVDLDGNAHLYSRTAKPYTGCLAKVEAELAANFAPGTWLDCEAVGIRIDAGQVIHDRSIVASVLGGGTPKSLAEQDKVSLMVFDLIAHADIDARGLRYAKRRALLERIFETKNLNRLTLVPQMKPTEATLKAVLAQGFEGLVVKRDVPYASGAKGKGWTKIKPEDTIDVIVTGFTDGENGFKGLIGAITFGAYDADGKLVEVGKCSGMTIPTREHMTANPDAWIGTIIEVAYVGGQPPPVYKHRRPDKAAAECTLDAVAAALGALPKGMGA